MMTKLMMAAVCLSVGAAAHAGDAVTFSSFAPAGGAETKNAGSVMNHRAAVVSGPSSRFATSRSISSVSTATTPQQEQVNVVSNPVLAKKGSLITPMLYGTDDSDDVNTPTPRIRTRTLSSEEPIVRDLGTTTSGERALIRIQR